MTQAITIDIPSTRRLSANVMVWGKGRVGDVVGLEAKNVTQIVLTVSFKGEPLDETFVLARQHIPDCL